MSVRNLDKLFKPRSVARSAQPHGPILVGGVVALNLGRAVFARELLLAVNPHHQTIDGSSVHPNVASLPHAPNLAVIITPPDPARLSAGYGGFRSGENESSLRKRPRFPYGAGFSSNASDKRAPGSPQPGAVPLQICCAR